MRLVCCKCKKVIREGDPTKTSHGFCDDCYKRIMAEMDDGEAEYERLQLMAQEDRY